MTAEYAFESLQSYPIYLWGGVTDCVAGCVNEKGQWGLHWDESDLLTKVVAAAVDVAAVGGSDDDDDVDDLGCLKGRKEIFFLLFVGNWARLAPHSTTASSKGNCVWPTFGTRVEPHGLKGSFSFLPLLQLLSAWLSDAALKVFAPSFAPHKGTLLSS